MMTLFAPSGGRRLTALNLALLSLGFAQTAEASPLRVPQGNQAFSTSPFGRGVAGPALTSGQHTFKISATQGGLVGPLSTNDRFGVACVSLGDIDGDGIGDMAVGANGDDDGGANRGAVWILFMNADGSVKAEQKISDTVGGFFGILDDGDQFGFSLGTLGDVDGDGLTDLAVGAIGDDDGGSNRGAVWILFLNSTGKVKASRKISQTSGGFFGTLNNGDLFGTSVAGLGDFNGDSNPDIAVGSMNSDDGGPNRGAVRLIALGTNVNVLGISKIASGSGGFGAGLDDGDNFGSSLAVLGDLNGDTFEDIAVGAAKDDDGGPNRGAAYVLFLNPAGTVISKSKISDGSGGFSGLADGDNFGSSMAALADRNGDGMIELAVGAAARDDGGLDRGAFYIIDLTSSGTAESSLAMSQTSGPLGVVLSDSDMFGRSICELDDLNGDGHTELFIGAFADDDGFPDAGAGYVAFLECVGKATVASRNGTGANPASFVSTTPPLIGATWMSTIDIATPGALASFIQIALGGPSPPVPLSGLINGELLVLPPFGPVFIATGVHGIPVSNDCSLVGQTFSLQGGTFKPGNIQLTNALDLSFGTY